MQKSSWFRPLVERCPLAIPRSSSRSTWASLQQASFQDDMPGHATPGMGGWKSCSRLGSWTANKSQSTWLGSQQIKHVDGWEANRSNMLMAGKPKTKSTWLGNQQIKHVTGWEANTKAGSLKSIYLLNLFKDMIHNSKCYV